MKKSILLKSLTIIACLLFSLSSLISCTTTNNVEDFARQDNVKFNRIVKDEEYLTTRIYYPTIGKNEELNHDIALTIYKDWNEYKDFALSNYKEGDKPYLFFAESRVVSNNESLNVDVMISHDYTEVEPSNIYTFNYTK